MNRDRSGRTALYRVFDADGALLYVGISGNPDVRLGHHSQTKDWWPDVADRKIEWHPTRAEAAAAERTAIKTELPKWNLQHSEITPTLDDETAALFARYKRHLEGERELRDEVREAAARELKAGAGVADLARMTGMTPEVFRRIARAEGVERRRPPTVGREVE